MVYSRHPTIDALGVSEQSKTKRAVSGTEFHRDFMAMLAGHPGVYAVRPKGKHNKGVVKVGKGGNLGSRINDYNRMYPEGIEVVYAKTFKHKSDAEQGKRYEQKYEDTLKSNLNNLAKKAKVPKIPTMNRSSEMYVADDAILKQAIALTDAKLASVPRGAPARRSTRWVEDKDTSRSFHSPPAKKGLRSSNAPKVPWWQVSANVQPVKEAEKKSKAASKKRAANRQCMCPCPCKD